MTRKPICADIYRGYKIYVEERDDGPPHIFVRSRRWTQDGFITVGDARQFIDYWRDYVNEYNRKACENWEPRLPEDTY